MKLYVIGSLRNPVIPTIASQLRSAGHEVFADWFAAGPEADDKWQAYEQSLGYSFKQALERPAARNVFDFDHKWLEWAEGIVLAMPAGKSGFFELGLMVGRGKPAWVYMPKEPERWDVMVQPREVGKGVQGIEYSMEELLRRIRGWEMSVGRRAA